MAENVLVLLVLLGGLSAQVAGSSPLPSENFPRSVELLPSGQLHLFWKYDKETITFEIHAKTHGYVGLGVSPGGSMKGADIALGWIKDGKIFFKDWYALKNEAPKIDPHQDWMLLTAKETSTHTIFKFRRKLITCDKRDFDITDETTRVIFAFHSEDPENEENLMWHGKKRGTKSMFLLTPRSSKPLPPGAESIDFVTVNHTIPHNHHTYYYCQGYSLQEMGILKEKRHFVKVEPILQKGKEGLVHHMILFYCPHKIVGIHHGVGYDCYGTYYGAKVNPIAKQLMKCRHMIAGWAIGGQVFTFPEGVGGAVGGLGPDETGSYMLEIHYDNPTKTPGITDVTGIRLWTTPKLQKIEAGVFMTGAGITNLQFIPPHVQSYKSLGYCSKECVADMLAGIPDGITVFSVILHGHLTIRQIRLRHFRNGIELQPILEDKAYDFNFQDFRPVSKPVKILPGDELMTECIYDTKTRSFMTWGGLATLDEMCISFLYHYPKVNLMSCLTNPTWQQSVHIVDGVRLNDPYSLNPKLTAPREYAGQKASSVISQLNWKENKLIAQAEYWTTVGNASLMNYCRNTSYQGHPSHRTIIRPTPVLKPWVPPTSPCEAKPTIPTSITPPRLSAAIWMTLFLVLTNIMFHQDAI